MELVAFFTAISSGRHVEDGSNSTIDAGKSCLSLGSRLRGETRDSSIKFIVALRRDVLLARHTAGEESKREQNGDDGELHSVCSGLVGFRLAG
jgi:hypothetical protein